MGLFCSASVYRGSLSYTAQGKFDMAWSKESWAKIFSMPAKKNRSPKTRCHKKIFFFENWNWNFQRKPKPELSVTGKFREPQKYKVLQISFISAFLSLRLLFNLCFVFSYGALFPFPRLFVNLSFPFSLPSSSLSLYFHLAKVNRMRLGTPACCSK